MSTLYNTLGWVSWRKEQSIKPSTGLDVTHSFLVSQKVIPIKQLRDGSEYLREGWDYQHFWSFRETGKWRWLPMGHFLGDGSKNERDEYLIKPGFCWELGDSALWHSRGQWLVMLTTCVCVRAIYSMDKHTGWNRFKVNTVGKTYAWVRWGRGK